jgi:hypothetical protein
MKQKLTLIGAMTSGHFLLWWLVVGALQLTRCDYFFWFGRELSFPLIALEDTPWPPFSWFRFILAVALNSSIWGVSLGILLYAVRQKVYKPVV